MNEILRVLVTLCVFCVLIVLLLWLGVREGVSSTVALTPDLDSEKLLYDDAFMDEALHTYTLRSLTTSLSRLGYARGIDCHDRAHELGRRAYELFGGDSFKSCGIECHSGCRHGATEAFFAEHGTADLVGSMEVLCGDEVGNQFHMHQCVHGVGHGLMAWYDYELHDALKACDLIHQEHHRNSCYSGVFMENIVGSISRDEGGDGYHYTNYLSDDPHFPCNAVADRYKGMCYWLQTDRMRALLGSIDAVGVACVDAPEPYQFSCFHSMGRTLSAELSFDPERGYAACMRVAHTPGKYWCLEGTLNNLFWDPTQADRAIAFCKLAYGSPFEKTCYDRLMARLTEVMFREDIQGFCEKLPEQYHAECMQRETPRAIALSVNKDSHERVFNVVEKTENPVIRYSDGRYIPDEVHISVGDEVVWVNESVEKSFWPASNIHPTHAAYPGSDIKKCSSSEREVIFDACEELPPGSEYSFVFDRTGQWRFHDHINPQATGVVIVSE